MATLKIMMDNILLGEIPIEVDGFEEYKDEIETLKNQTPRQVVVEPVPKIWLSP